MRSAYMPIPAVVEGVVDETPAIKTFALRPAESLPFEVGQFRQLTVPGVGEAPFSLPSSPMRSGIFQLGIRRAGTLTIGERFFSDQATLTGAS